MEPGQEYLKLIRCWFLAMGSCSLTIGLGTIVGFPRLSEAFVVVHLLKGKLVA